MGSIHDIKQITKISSDRVSMTKQVALVLFYLFAVYIYIYININININSNIPKLQYMLYCTVDKVTQQRFIGLYCTESALGKTRKRAFLPLFALQCSTYFFNDNNYYDKVDIQCKRQNSV